MKHSFTNLILTALTYVVLGAATDVFTIVADSNPTADGFLDEFEKHIELVHLDQITWLLGMTVTRNLTNRTISLGQEAYVYRPSLHSIWTTKRTISLNTITIWNRSLAWT